jgi:mRNA interferase RelE/StbE
VAYRIELTTRAARQLEELEPRDRKRIAARIDALATDPRPASARKLAGSDDLYRIRAGDYRVIYRVQDRVVLITVIRIGHRRDIYR